MDNTPHKRNKSILDGLHVGRVKPLREAWTKKSKTSTIVEDINSTLMKYIRKYM